MRIQLYEKTTYPADFFNKRRRNDKLYAFLLSGFLRPFLVIEKENIRVLIAITSFSTLSVIIVICFLGKQELKK